MKNNFLEINYIVLAIIYISYHIYYTFGAVMRIFRIWGIFVNDCTSDTSLKYAAWLRVLSLYMSVIAMNISAKPPWSS